LNSNLVDIKEYQFSWEVFGGLLEGYVLKNLEELKNVDMIISFKRGGSILGQALACIVQDLISETSNKIIIRDMPSGIVQKGNPPTFLNRFVASTTEISDIPKLKKELNKEIQERNKNKKGKINILVIDDNITTCLRQRLISEIILHWFGNKVNVLKLAFCVQTDKKQAIDYIIFDDLILKNAIVKMPWHRLRKVEPENLERKNYIQTVIIPNKNEIDLDLLIDTFKEYINNIYETLGLKGVIKLNNNIFNIKHKYYENKEFYEINSGSFGFKIYRCNKELCISLTNFTAIPKLCEQNKFAINDPIYRICKSEFSKNENCYECIHLYCSRDIFYIIVQFLKKMGMKEKEIENISIKFCSNKFINTEIEEYVPKYLKHLYQEQTIPEIYKGGLNES
jgi:hypothetical protein